MGSIVPNANSELCKTLKTHSVISTPTAVGREILVLGVETAIIFFLNIDFAVGIPLGLIPNNRDSCLKHTFGEMTPGFAKPP
jgi:hypothetical protein